MECLSCSPFNYGFACDRTLPSPTGDRTSTSTGDRTPAPIGDRISYSTKGRSPVFSQPGDRIVLHQQAIAPTIELIFMPTAF